MWRGDYLGSASAERETRGKRECGGGGGGVDRGEV